MGQHADDRAAVDPAGFGLLLEVLVRPLDHHLVGVREPAVGREHGPRVADGDVVAEERADPRDRGREVDGAEDQHPGRRGERPDEDAHPLAASFAVGAVGQGRVVPGGQQAERIVEDRRVGAVAAQRAGHGLGAYDDPAADPLGVRVLDHGGQRDGAAGVDVVGDLTELGEGLLVHLLDVHVEDAAAGQADRERVVVGDAVALEDGSAGPRPRTGRARRPRPRRNRRRPSRPRTRQVRPASTHRPVAGRSARWRPPCRRRRSRRPPTTAAARRGPHARPTTCSTSSKALSEWPATKSSQCGSAAAIPCCTGS